MRVSQKQLDKWAKIRRMGRSRYVRNHWVLGWGLTVAIVWSFWMAFEKGWGQLPIFLVLALIGFPFGGYFLGRMMWRLSEKQYLRAYPEA